MSLMTPRAIQTMRRTALRWMVDTVEVWRGSSSEFDDVTHIEDPVDGTKIWEGPARVRPTSGPREQAISEGVLTMRDADILYPLTAQMLRRDDEVFVKTSDDPELQGTWFRVTDVRAFSQQAARKASMIQAQPSRLWPLGTDD